MNLLCCVAYITLIMSSVASAYPFGCDLAIFYTSLAAD